jgi:hypothetical protein
MQNDKQREQAAKPSAGPDTSRHAGKDPKNQSRPNSGVAAVHGGKADGLNRIEPISKPGPSGGAVRPQKKDKNTASAGEKFSSKVG